MKVIILSPFKKECSVIILFTPAKVLLSFEKKREGFPKVEGGNPYSRLGRKVTTSRWKRYQLKSKGYHLAWYIWSKDTTSAWYIWSKDTTSAWYIWQKIPPRHGTFDEKIPPQGEMYHGKHGTLGERYQGENERYQAFGERYQGKTTKVPRSLVPLKRNIC